VLAKEEWGDTSRALAKCGCPPSKCQKQCMMQKSTGEEAYFPCPTLTVKRGPVECRRQAALHTRDLT
jgi:hypothetical protein